MSFGRPPGITGILVTPPDRGSFPLDHDAECKSFMMVYLKCLKDNKSQNGACRPQSKDYLECRMQKGLMERDDWTNLGLSNVSSSTTFPNSSTTASSSQPRGS
ncbi:uncharacterized protein EI90DRAFT_3072179 [Cantharellus anzutake]|uniref:uncharacterized protein n=1 Tax=Cantharellus anzutake TaxID=1750568 RepID=UPI001907397E|nr:uncharacterized protein EI90DRAFT_3072179 [Cantharellus anzutake]KAF8325898.1 hypothetical protein EI90DRAFT_3072179 [Cantharellus anzutake]